MGSVDWGFHVVGCCVMRLVGVDEMMKNLSSDEHDWVIIALGCAILANLLVWGFIRDTLMRMQ